MVNKWPYKLVINRAEQKTLGRTFTASFLCSKRWDIVKFDQTLLLKRLGKKLRPCMEETEQ